MMKLSLIIISPPLTKGLSLNSEANFYINAGLLARRIFIINWNLLV